MKAVSWRSSTSTPEGRGSGKGLDQRVGSGGDASGAASAQRRVTKPVPKLFILSSLSAWRCQLLLPAPELEPLSVGIGGVKANKCTPGGKETFVKG